MNIARYIPILFILLFAYALRLPLLNGSFWLDEAAQVLESRRSLAEQHVIFDDFQPPLLHYITHFMLYVSQSEFWLRQVSVIAGIGTIYCLYRLVEQSHGKTKAILASTLLATSSFHIFFSQELRPYSLATFFATASWYALSRASIGKTRRTWLLFTILSILGLYSMYIYPLIIVSQGVYIFIHQPKIRKHFLYAVCIMALCGLPWLPSFLGQLKVGTTLTTQLPGWSQAVSVPQLKALPLTLAKFFTGQVLLEGNTLRMALFSLPIVLFFISAYTLRQEKKSFLYLYWFFIPILGAWLISFVVPVIAPKRLMVSLPALFSILAIATVYSHNKYVQPFVLFCVLLLNLATTLLYYRQPLYQREDWNGLIAQMENEAPPESVALFSFPDSFAPWKIYSSNRIEAVATGKLLLTDASDLSETFTSSVDTKTVYVFEYLRDLTDPHQVIDQWLVKRGYTQTSSIDGKQIGFVRRYDKITNF